MPLAASTAPLSFEEYLAAERVAETKHEFHGGHVFAMAGGTGPHSQIAVGLKRELSMFAKAKGCSVFNSDMKVRIPANDCVLYPDVSGLCARPEYFEQRRATCC